jgi:hypothetical protein
LLYPLTSLTGTRRGEPRKRYRLADVSVVRLVIAVAVVVLLARSAQVAWRNRGLAVAVWRRIRPHHVVGSVGLLIVVLTFAVGLMTLVPVTQYGLGSVVGLTGNAVFAPVEEAAQRSGSPDLLQGDTAGSSWWLTAAVGVFLTALLAMFPWLAYAEERTFRWGLERATLGRELFVALRFGLIHLVMLIPIAAALAIAVAGFFYGRVYRRAYVREVAGVTVELDPWGNPVIGGPSPAEVRSRAVLASTVWHTSFNSLIVVLVIIGLVLGI